MRKSSKNTIIIILIVITVTFLLPHQANAGWTCILFNAGECIKEGGLTIFASVVAEIGNLILGVVSYMLTVAGLFFNVAMKLALNMSTLYKATPAIEQVWTVIRNVSSIFIIFFLIYTSIITILGGGSSKLKELIGKIILAGLFINFSLFFTKLAIDASNLVSMQFYRGIAPQYNATLSFETLISGAYLDGGISNIYMEALRIPSVFHPRQGIINESSLTTYLTILNSTISGTILIIIAAWSFFGAAIAVVIRVIALILLMAFSPIYFVGIIFPQIKSKLSDPWLGWLIKELIFLPAYLLLVYVSMSFLKGGFYASLSTASTGGDPKNAVLLSSVSLLMQFTIGIILTLFPLYAATQIGGISAKYGNIAKKWAGGYLGKKTVGNLASEAEKKLENSKYGNNALIRDLRGMTTQKAMASKFGGYSSLNDDKKAKKEKDAKDRQINNIGELDTAIVSKDTSKIKAALSKMSTSEIASLEGKKLSDKLVIPHLTSAVYAAVEKGDKTDKEKTEISGARKEKLLEAIVEGENTEVKGIMKNLSGEELQKFIEENYGAAGSVPEALIGEIRGNQLKDMDSMDESKRKEIGNAIKNWSAGTHQANKFISDNKDAWTSSVTPTADHYDI